MNNQKAEEYSVKEIFSSDQYVIPLYQRNYAWTEREVLQLVQDVADYAAKKDKPTYRIGSLIVHQRPPAQGGAYETIDGQQRLTTLIILLCALKQALPDKLAWFQQLNLAYDSRPAATATLEALLNSGPVAPAATHPEIRHAYDVAAKALRNLESENGLSVPSFSEYLTRYVKVLRVPVPPDTDLNHYFEIMNSRGEQLEKHEVLKAKLLGKLGDDAATRHCFTRIWEACADMERYVQYGFTKDQRKALFDSEWRLLRVGDFAAVQAVLSDGPANDGGAGSTLDDILAGKAAKPREETTIADRGEASRFSSVINFPNFLLHILRIQVAREQRGREVPLDDKGLVDVFMKQVEQAADKPQFVKYFAYHLLRGRNLLDTYVLKRESGSTVNGWSLKALKWDGEKSVQYVNTFPTDQPGTTNREVLMLLAMFHVTTTTQSYKHWLNAALKYLFENAEPTAAAYRDHLQQLADAFLFNHFLTNDEKDYYKLIYERDGVILNRQPKWELLDRGTAVENFVFNYLDFLLWQQGDPMERSFDFTSNNSVEHFYPQNPPEYVEKKPQETLDLFGNLCLISASKNSKLSNHLPLAKRGYYKEGEYDSLKQRRMMMQAINWDNDAIEKHGEEMKFLFQGRYANPIS